MARRGHKCRCCEGEFCLVADGKPRTDPANEGTWVPDAVWTDERDEGAPLLAFTNRYNSVSRNSSWTFVPREQAGPGNTWFFFGSATTSAPGRRATAAEIYDWGNICNWYSDKAGEPPFAVSSISGFANQFPKRANRLPPSNAVVHMYSPFTTSSVGPQTVKQMYVWEELDAQSITPSSLDFNVTATTPFPQITEMDISVLFRGRLSASKILTNRGTIGGGALFLNACNGLAGVSFFANGRGTVNGSAMFSSPSSLFMNFGTINGDGWFYGGTSNGRVNNGASVDRLGRVVRDAKFFQNSRNWYRVEGKATFRGESSNQGGRVGGLAEFFDESRNFGELSSADFYDNSINDIDEVFLQFKEDVTVDAVFRNNSINRGLVSGSAVFFDNTRNNFLGRVLGTATFNDAACSEARAGIIDPVTQECRLFFSANNNDPASVICNGSAPRACDDLFATCGCG
jgi:hypothetical protein